MRTFAGEQLSMVPLLLGFLEDVVEPAGKLPEHVQCFKLFAQILDLLATGPTEAATQHARLRTLVLDHHRLYRGLYPDGIKPKWHHMMHIDEHATSLGKILSCFPTERKHRQVKSAALWVWRHYEHTLIRSLLNRQAQVLGDPSLFAPVWLEHPKTQIIDGTEVTSAPTCDLPCGMVHRQDIVLTRTGAVCEILFFWCFASHDTVFAQVQAFAPTGTANTWVRNPANVQFLPAADILCTLAWATHRTGVLRVLLPFRR